MEDEPRLGSPSADARWLTFAELADELCPVYMSMGVPWNEFWHGDYTQLAAYRKAFEISRERVNHDAWLYNAYTYDVLCMVSPVLHAFAPKGTKPMPYHRLPYGEKEAVDPEVARAEFLTKWKANKARWKANDKRAAVSVAQRESGGLDGNND